MSHPLCVVCRSSAHAHCVPQGYLASSNPYPVEVADYPIRALAFNTSDPAEACNPYPAETGDLSKYTVIVRCASALSCVARC